MGDPSAIGIGFVLENVAARAAVTESVATITAARTRTRTNRDLRCTGD